MRNHAFFIFENKGADQLHGNRAAGQRLSFCYVDTTIPLLPKSKILSLLQYSIVVSDLVRNTEDRFSHDTTFFFEDISPYSADSMITHQILQ